jgi:hypothetical protein
MVPSLARSPASVFACLVGVLDPVLVTTGQREEEDKVAR